MQTDRRALVGRQIQLWVASIALVSLAACTTAPDPNANLYAISAEKAYAILDAAELPAANDIADSVFAQFDTRKDDSDPQTLIWNFAHANANMISAHIHFAPEGLATRVTVDVKFGENPSSGAPASRQVTAQMAASPNLRELYRQYFVEFVDATLLARPFDINKGGKTYALAHAAEIAAESKKLNDAQLASTKPPAAPTPATATATPAQPAAPAKPYDPSAPSVDPAPTMAGTPTVSPTPSVAAGSSASPPATATAATSVNHFQANQSSPGARGQ